MTMRECPGCGGDGFYQAEDGFCDFCWVCEGEGEVDAAHQLAKDDEE